MSEYEDFFDRFADVSIWPLVTLLVAGFLIGGLGHLYGSRGAVGTGIALVFLAVVVVPFFVALGR